MELRSEGKRQKEIVAALKAAQHDVERGAWVEPSRMTMNQWFDLWLADYQGHTTGRTVETYKSVIKNHMRPVFGSVKLSSFGSVHVRRMIASMKSLSPSTIKHARGILSAALNDAIEAGLMKSNPVETVKGPRTVKPEFAIIDREHIPVFIEAAHENPLGNAMIFLLLTGLRVGELRGLRWSDIDMERQTMRIERQLRQVNKNDIRIGPPKDGEQRTVYLTPEAINLLKQQRKDQLADKLKAADWFEDEITRDLVFRDPTGHNLSQNVVYATVKSLRDPLGLPTLRAHDLRHSYAVAALRSGIDVKTVQHNLGHKHASITLDIYAAYTEDAGKLAAEKLSKYLQKPLK